MHIWWDSVSSCPDSIWWWYSSRLCHTTEVHSRYSRNHQRPSLWQATATQSLYLHIPHLFAPLGRLSLRHWFQPPFARDYLANLIAGQRSHVYRTISSLYRLLGVVAWSTMMLRVRLCALVIVLLQYVTIATAYNFTAINVQSSNLRNAPFSLYNDRPDDCPPWYSPRHLFIMLTVL